MPRARPLVISRYLSPLNSSMLIHSLPDQGGSYCLLTYDEANGWLRATWHGFVDAAEAMHGAESYLCGVAQMPCAYLLNDNLALRGPWFDSVEWLQHAWLPHARRLGLRYVAHVVQADTRTDVLTLNFPKFRAGGDLELQIFERLAEAEDWLRACQQAAAAVAK